MSSFANAEIFAATTLLVVLGTSVLTSIAGLSLALGAFLAGLLIAETEYALQVCLGGGGSGSTRFTCCCKDCPAPVCAAGVGGGLTGACLQQKYVVRVCCPVQQVGRWLARRMVCSLREHRSITILFGFIHPSIRSFIHSFGLLWPLFHTG